MKMGSRILAAGAALAAFAGGAAVAAPAKVVELTQVGCQFIESENGVDHRYKTAKKADCDAINARTAAERLSRAAPLRLKPGRYVFRVSNRNVPYELGFWLRDADYNPSNPLHKLTGTSVSGGGLTEGKARDYEVTLKPGDYVYSCPLNATPNYRLVVAE